jgi:hypothetical protein
MSSARLSRFVWIGLNWIGWTQVTDQARTISSCTIDRDRIETISSMISQSQRTRQTKSKQITNASKKQHPGRAAAVARIVLVVLIELQSLLAAIWVFGVWFPFLRGVQQRLSFSERSVRGLLISRSSPVRESGSSLKSVRDGDGQI